jgi:hypothetical protein
VSIRPETFDRARHRQELCKYTDLELIPPESSWPMACAGASNVRNAYGLRESSWQAPSSTYATALKPSSFGSYCGVGRYVALRKGKTTAGADSESRSPHNYGWRLCRNCAGPLRKEPHLKESKNCPSAPLIQFLGSCIGWLDKTCTQRRNALHDRAHWLAELSRHAEAANSGHIRWRPFLTTAACLMTFLNHRHITRNAK